MRPIDRRPTRSDRRDDWYFLKATTPSQAEVIPEKRGVVKERDNLNNKGVGVKIGKEDQ